MSMGVVGVASAQAGATSPSVTVSPSTNLVNNQQLLVQGSGLSGDNGDFLVECLTTATDTTGCDTSTEVAISVDGSGDLSPAGFTTATGTIGSGTCGTGSTDASSCDLAIAAASSGPVTALAPLTFAVLSSVNADATLTCSKVTGAMTFSSPMKDSSSGTVALQAIKITGSHCAESGSPGASNPKAPCPFCAVAKVTAHWTEIIIYHPCSCIPYVTFLSPWASAVTATYKGKLQTSSGVAFNSDIATTTTGTETTGKLIFSLPGTDEGTASVDGSFAGTDGGASSTATLKTNMTPDQFEKDVAKKGITSIKITSGSISLK